jgi:hypothetical protein
MTNERGERESIANDANYTLLQLTTGFLVIHFRTIRLVPLVSC